MTKKTAEIIPFEHDELQYEIETKTATHLIPGSVLESIAMETMPIEELEGYREIIPAIVREWLQEIEILGFDKHAASPEKRRMADEFAYQLPSMSEEKVARVMNVLCPPGPKEVRP